MAWVEGDAAMCILLERVLVLQKRPAYFLRNSTIEPNPNLHPLFFYLLHNAFGSHEWAALVGATCPQISLVEGKITFLTDIRRGESGIWKWSFFFKKKPLPHTHSWQAEKMNRRIKTICFFFPSFARKGPGYFARGCKVRTPTQRKEASRWGEALRSNHFRNCHTYIAGICWRGRDRLFLVGPLRPKE